MYTLEDLISPINIDDFLTFYKSVEAFHVSGSENRFSELFSWKQFNYHLNNSEFTGNQLNIVDNTRSLKNETHKKHSWGTKGATFILNGVNHKDQLVRDLTESLASETNMGVACNCYASFPGTQGFDLHFDTHDVLVLQLSGSKHWKVFHPTVKYPIGKMGKANKNKIPAKSTPPYLECTLTEGDVLYIPRGHWHYALSETPSLHFTVGLHNTSSHQFLQELVKKLLWGDEFLRIDAPTIQSKAFGGEREDEEFDAHLEKFRGFMTNYIQNADLKKLFVEWQMHRNKVSIGAPMQLPYQAALNDFITPDITFVIREHQKTLISFDESLSRTTVIARGAIIDFDNTFNGLMQWILHECDTIDGNRIMEKFPDLSWDQVKKILLGLYSQEVTTLADAP